MRDGDSYLREFYTRLPRGQIWPTVDSEATVWNGLLDALASEFGRVRESAESWLADFFPDVTSDQLADWERILGLPDCGLALGTIDERRAAVVARLRRFGDPTLANIQLLADSFDKGAIVSTGGTSSLFYVDGITEVDGVNEVTTDAAAFTVTVTYDSPQSDTLECVLRHAIPFHLEITFVVV